MAPTIKPNVRYRIQNVDFGTFLERRDRNRLLMRPMKETLQQQWFFNENLADENFQILNAADKGYILDASNSGPSFRIVSERARNAQGPKWKLAYGRSRELYIVSAEVGDEDVLLRCESDHGAPKLVQDTNINDIAAISKDDDYRWKILEVSPASLPDGDGKYRIRTLNGYAIHSESGKKSISIANQDRGDHRAWEIISLGNGRCTIKNVQEDAFLATEMTDNEWTPVLSKTMPAPEWYIESLGNFTYSIIVERAIDDTREPRRLSLTLKDDTIILKPMKAAHNQLWHIEATDAPLDRPQPGPTPPGVELTTVPTESKKLVLAGLWEGEYLLYSDLGYYLYVNPTNLDIILSQTQTSYFKIELVQNSGSTSGSAQVHLIHSDSRRHIYYTVLASGSYMVSLGDLNSKMTWRLNTVVIGTTLKFTILDHGSPTWGLSTTNTSRPIYSADRTSGHQNWSLFPKPT